MKASPQSSIMSCSQRRYSWITTMAFLLLLSISSPNERMVHGLEEDLEVFEEDLETHQNNIKEYYKHYPSYPEYCTTPTQQHQRKIPPLKDGNSVLVNVEGVTLQLKHVTAVVRHGARTPIADTDCWEGYTTADGNVWNCDLKTISNPPASPALDFEHYMSDPSNPSSTSSYDITAMSGEGAHFGFEKIYDGLYSTKKNWMPPNIRNTLGHGTCQAGQLLLRGYDQELTNGLFLRNAYVKDEMNDVNVDTDSSYLLYDFSDSKDGTQIMDERAYDEPKLYFRSDDDQRTIMSGQVVIRGLFGDLMAHHAKMDSFRNSYSGLGWGGEKQPMVRVHTADRDRDIISPNHDVCPKLEELEYEALGSVAYRSQFVTSAEAELLKDLRKNGLSGSTSDDAEERMSTPSQCMDCLMTTICTDRDLHPLLNDYGIENPHSEEITELYGEELFKRMMDFATLQTAFKYSWNDAAYSKLAMSPLWSDMLAHILVHTPANQTILEEEWPEENKRYGNKLALYSVHDSTLMALLSHLDEAEKLFWTGAEWPPYASMFLIELYEYNMTDAFRSTAEGKWYDTGVVFRLIFNGKVISDSLDGCNDELCDIAILILHLYGDSSITDWDLRCEQTDTYKSLMSGDDDEVYKPIPPVEEEDPQHALSTFGRNLGVFCALLMSGMIGALITYSVMMKKMLNSTVEERSTLELTESGPSHPISGGDYTDDVPQDGPIYGLNVDRGVAT